MKKKTANTSKSFWGVCLITGCLLATTFVISGCNRSETENNTVVPQSTADTTTAGQSATEKPIESGAKNMISSDEAKRVALAHAGVPEDKAERYESHLEREDGRQVYEIEFDFENQEYDYEIDVETGTIIKFGKEPK